MLRIEKGDLLCRVIVVNNTEDGVHLRLCRDEHSDENNPDKKRSVCANDTPPALRLSLMLTVNILYYNRSI